MKKLILSILLIAPLALMAQKGNFTFDGKVGNLSAPAKVYLAYDSPNGTIIDSTVFQNGQFKFKGTVNSPIPATILINRTGSGIRDITKNEWCVVYLEPGNISVNSPDYLAKAKISGSKINDDNQKLTRAMKSNDLKFATLSKEFGVRARSKEINDTEPMSVWYKRRSDPINNERNQIYLKFIKENPNSFISLTSLMTYYGNSHDIDEVLTLFHALSKEVKSTNMGNGFLNDLGKTKATAIGAIAPEFTQNDAEGKPIKLSDFKGKYVLIDFWASWCGPCRAENPNVVKAYATYHDKGLEILGVSFDSKKEAWIKAIADDKLIWKHVSDLKGKKNEVGALYLVESVPQNLLIDPTGKIIAKDLRGEELETKLAEILK